MKAGTKISQNHFRIQKVTLAASLLLSGCAADPSLFNSIKKLTDDPLATQKSQAQAAQSVRVRFHYSDYYTLTDPSPSGCAGDAKRLYDPLALDANGPVPLPLSVFGAEETIKPSFIKNVSVDMTDTNAHVNSNQTFACSLGNSITAPPVSSCATFDYGAIGGIPTTMGGTLLLIGGVKGYNYAGQLPGTSTFTGFPFRSHTVSCGPVEAAASLSAPIGYTSCSTGMYALGVDTLPASVAITDPNLAPGLLGQPTPTGPVSTWADIQGPNTNPTGNAVIPQGYAGAVATYDALLQKVLLFSGAAPLANLGSTAPGVTTYDTWTFDLKAQAWSFLFPTVSVDTVMQTVFDMDLDIQAAGGATVSTAPFSIQLNKAVGARALFGYVSVPGMGFALDQAGTTGAMSATMIDKTDRLMIIGGLSSNGVFSGTHAFNPTYAPELKIGWGVAPAAPAGKPIDLTGSGVTLNGTEAVQWASSYHTRLLNNTYGLRFTTGAARYNSLSSNYTPDMPPTAQGSLGGDYPFSSAFAPLVNNSGAGNGNIGTGYLAGAGGFTYNATTSAANAQNAAVVGGTAAQAVCSLTGAFNTTGPADAGGTATLNCGGGLLVNTRFYPSGSAGTLNENSANFWGALTNFINPNTSPFAPALWTQVPENSNGSAAGASLTVPWVGGASLLPGFNLNTNDLVYFGGLDCSGYLDAAATCGPYRNSGRYWSFGTNPAAALGSVPADGRGTTTWNGTAVLGPPVDATNNKLPVKAGMATARGLDPSGRPIILAWGGVSDAGTIEGKNRLYFLFASAAPPAAATYSWAYADPTNSSLGGTIAASDGVIPDELVNSQMVYSHVTGKYYMFGGYSPTSLITHADTFELTISSAGNAACNATGNCTFTFRNLTSGISCYPSACPIARRSHRMAEVNYFNRNPGGVSGAALSNGESTCAAGTPCSYGIFMEGGNSDGVHFLSDRWMFDPTANGGSGHWQQMGELPPRTLSALATVDYTPIAAQHPAHRAIMFGGETGLHSPEMAVTGKFFVPPTLGDTWMFDYDNNTWNRVALLGRGYNGGLFIPGSASNTADSSEVNRRQAYNALVPGTFSVANDLGNNTNQNELSPPPLSGAIMVTRTMSPPTGVTNFTTGVVTPPTATSPLKPLAIPEVYLIGGRKKDGSYNAIDHVYKFCAGSTGEAFIYNPVVAAKSIPDVNDYSCDAFNATTNPNSPSPLPDFAGRWLRKQPPSASVSVTNSASFMGAGAYDSVRDRIVVFGGLFPLNGAATIPAPTVTDQANIGANASIWEYTPPQPQLGGATSREGQWNFVPSCTPYTAPLGRYGHTLAYNSLNRSILMTGGFSSLGVPKTQTITYANGASYDIPEVWEGTFYATATPSTTNTQNPGITITNAPCYYWKPITTFGNDFTVSSQAPPFSGLAHAASVFIPSAGFNTGYYSMFDNACEKAGPIATTDATVNKLLAGGAYFDIDRSALGANENLLLNLTYIPMGTTNTGPDSQHLTPEASAVFKVHLIRTGISGDTMRQIQQPRYLAFSDTSEYPEVAQSISVLAPPTGQITQEQILIPLSIDSAIDRIRIERYSGTGILLDAALYRMGTK